MSGPLSATNVVTLDALARPSTRRSAPSLRALASAAAGFGAPHALIARTGRVASSALDRVRVEGLGPDVVPGDVLEVGEAHALVLRCDAGAVHAVPDAPVPCGASARRVAVEVRADASWLGRALDPLLRPLDDGAPPVPGALGSNPRASSQAPIALGIGALDLMCPPDGGEAWAVVGPAGSGRTALLAAALAAERDEVVVHAALGPRWRERVALIAEPACALSIVGARDDGPAATARTLAAALSASRSLRAEGDVLLVIDDADRVPPDILAARVREAGRAGITVLAALREPAPWADGTIVLEGGGVDWPATLARCSQPTDARAVEVARVLRDTEASDERAGLLSLLSAMHDPVPPSREALEAALGACA